MTLRKEPLQVSLLWIPHPSGLGNVLYLFWPHSPLF
jgi:hypothetical protein